jgi:hypothetical protein
MFWQGILQQSARADSGSNSKFIPRLSPMILGLALRSNQPLVSKEVDTNLFAMMQLEPNFSWSSWEKFLAHYESLRSQLYALLSEPSASVKELYPGAIALNPCVLNNQVPMVSRSVHFLDKKLVPSQAESAHFSKSVVIPAPNTAGFDIAISHSDNKWILIEARYSEQDGRLESNSIGEKYRLILEGQDKICKNDEHAGMR